MRLNAYDEANARCRSLIGLPANSITRNLAAGKRLRAASRPSTIAMIVRRRDIRRRPVSPSRNPNTPTTTVIMTRPRRRLDRRQLPYISPLHAGEEQDADRSHGRLTPADAGDERARRLRRRRRLSRAAPRHRDWARHSGRGRARYRRCVRDIAPCSAVPSSRRCRRSSRPAIRRSRSCLTKRRPGGAPAIRQRCRKGRANSSFRAQEKPVEVQAANPAAARGHDDPGHFQRSGRADAGWSADRMRRPRRCRPRPVRCGHRPMAAARPAQRPRLGGASLWRASRYTRHHQATAAITARRRCRADRHGIRRAPAQATPASDAGRLREPRTASAGGPLSIVPGGRVGTAPPLRHAPAPRRPHTGGADAAEFVASRRAAPARRWLRGAGLVAAQRGRGPDRVPFAAGQISPRARQPHADIPPRRSRRQRQSTTARWSVPLRPRNRRRSLCRSLKAAGGSCIVQRN